MNDSKHNTSSIRYLVILYKNCEYPQQTTCLNLFHYWQKFFNVNLASTPCLRSSSIILWYLRFFKFIYVMMNFTSIKGILILSETCLLMLAVLIRIEIYKILTGYQHFDYYQIFKMTIDVNLVNVDHRSQNSFFLQIFQICSKH